MTEMKRRFYRGSDAGEFFHQGKGATADAVVIGGGIIGPSVALHLEKLNPGAKIVTLESNSDLAQDAPANSAECLRVVWTPQSIANMALFSHRVIMQADDYFYKGAKDEIDFQNRGYLFLAQNEEEGNSLKESVELMKSWNMPGIFFLDRQDLRKNYPWLPPHMIAAQVDSNAGWLNSYSLANIFSRSCQSAAFVMDTQTNKIIIKNYKVSGVETSRGIIHTEKVIIAAGPGSHALAKTVGIDLPIVSVPKQIYTSRFRHDNIPKDAPLVIGSSPKPYFRPQSEGLLLGCSYDDDIYGQPIPELREPTGDVKRFKDPGFPARVLNELKEQFRDEDNSGFADPRYLTSGGKETIGYYVYRQPGDITSRSERAIIDSGQIEGLTFAVAHAGHGIMTSPAVGVITASLVWDQEPPIPLWQQFGLHVETVDYERNSGL